MSELKPLGECQVCHETFTLVSIGQTGSQLVMDWHYETIEDLARPCAGSQAPPVVK